MSIDTKQTAQELAKIAVSKDNELQMCRVDGGITSCSASIKNHPFFEDMFHSAQALGDTFGKSITAGAVAGLMTQNPLIGGAFSAAVAITNVFSGSSKKPGREV